MDDHASGELVEGKHFGVEDSPVQVGDEVIFRLRHAAFQYRRLPELTGVVLGVLEGHELVAVVKVHEGLRPWTPQLVRMADIARVKFF